MMETVFRLVAETLNGIACATGFTYIEVNIIVFYGIIPLIYAAMIDRIIRKVIVTPLYLLVILSVLVFADFSAFSDWFFGVNVKFLNSFGFMGMDYVVASVVICVIVPSIIAIVLFRFSYWPPLKKFVARVRQGQQEQGLGEKLKAEDKK